MHTDQYFCPELFSTSALVGADRTITFQRTGNIPISSSFQRCDQILSIMALHLGARTLGLGRLVQQVLRPASVAAFQAEPGQLLAECNVTDSVYAEGTGSQLEESCLLLSLPPLQRSGGNGRVANAVKPSVHFRTLGTDAAAAVSEAGGRESNEEFAEGNVEESDQTALQQEKGERKDISWEDVERPRERTPPQSDRGQKPRRPSARSRLEMRGKLLNALRRWAPDVDLDAQLPDGKLNGKDIDVRALRAVIFQIAKGPGRARRVTIEGEEADEGPQYRCSQDDARRALNAFEWWLRRDTGAKKDPLEDLLDPLLQVLAAAGMGDEIMGLWEKYRSLAAKGNDMVVQQFLGACLHSNMPEKIVPMYEEAQANRWPMRMKAADMVVRAMHELRRPRDEIHAFYKSWVEQTGNELNQRPAFVALLESGVTVEEIRSMKYKEPSRVANRLIQALSTIGRTEEARVIVQEILEPEGGLQALGVLTLVSMLRTLIHAGFIAEAQQLADRQEELGVRLDGALAYVLKTTEKVQTGLEAYRTLQAIEGPHRRSLSVQSMLIKNVYAKLNQTELMYQAYLAGREFEGEFHAGILSDVIQRLALANRVAEVEEVLADYFRARRESQDVSVLPEKAFEEIAEMYLRDARPEKLVALAKEMVNQNHFVASGLMTHWAKLLIAGDLIAESQEVLDARDVMNELRAKWIEKMRKKGVWVSRPRRETGEGEKVEAETETETEAEAEKGGERAEEEEDGQSVQVEKRR
ncbi:hypothetical protein KFL_001720050 [Klebsormidium nitens]|uniref:Uncharacterized protein n=1 Tax=Klebsormidium nitens TaxID=105231 RepID=A0A0U9HRV7_KLENI|nr:hypothetical protein KFL_001720050 [Klebsormidium nitens]|eukprot:GAQ83992.1 hypothetical protein KFL_001720050 [Klebsormidium nitens]